ncbi:hypothetical protein K493DRAFT_287634 [Basidiobolus meristosporus CBS 931.73]|uniref:BEACH domain-containing protein n=1 Tax=Basidiobolus meristosporus CBS 931.73 TaxID=1314790 RepID=A0A1Y1XZK0_9FUNG|nr:hypothetical protein K493DRAFT_287634 [Basidiobolus meristosporus CBS 931.73]|eukprot:ORX90794.1 hypothetical protein K493DRAFT_287634 [Basidiobolus meristosporus CBS 931.73]
MMRLFPQCKHYQIIQNENPGRDTLTLEFLPSQETHQRRKSIPNVLEPFALIESSRAYYFLATNTSSTLEDMLNFNPRILQNSNTKRSFIVYQLLKSISQFHSHGILHGGLKLSNIFIDEHLWLSITGFQGYADKVSQVAQFLENDRQYNIPPEIEDEPLVMKWVRGEIPNFRYILMLNHLAGRRVGDPNFHPVFPWITDFTGNTVSEHWRDFSKTKFRLNKGDEQLDVTFESPLPHHITDILSDITYYVYLARKTPIPVLCQYVRSKYEPNEYPSTMQRLFEWTPDECIPEFYTDPSIFKSIHPDMPDLMLPKWANSAEDFIEKHADALESDYVSANLHSWVDLTFGYKLNGIEAIESKNVALPLIPENEMFMKHGVKQLFSEPHPQRACNWNNTRISTTRSRKNTLRSLNSDKQIKLLSDKLSELLSTANEKHSKSPNGGGKSKAIKPSTPGKSVSDSASSSIKEREFPVSSATDQKEMNKPEFLSALLNTEPINLPHDIADNLFVEEFEHHEQAIQFGLHYGFDENPLQESLDVDVFKSSFQSPVSSYITSDLQDILNSLLLSEWPDKPTTEAILYASISTTCMDDKSLTLPFPSFIPDIYDYLSSFYQCEWDEKVALAKSWIDRLCKLEDEAFDLVLPSFVMLFNSKETRLESLKLFGKVAERLGSRGTRIHLLKPLTTLFEASKPHLPVELFSHVLIDQLVRFLGVNCFLQQLFPFYIEAFSVAEMEAAKHKYPQRLDMLSLSKEVEYMEELYVINEDIKNPFSPLIASTIIYICTLIGPILTSKYVIKQLIKVAYKEHCPLVLLQELLISIGNKFGETFISIQYSHLISVVEQQSRNLTKRNFRLLCNLVSLLEKLTGHISSAKIMIEIKGAFSETLYQLLENSGSRGNKLAADAEELRNHISRRIIDYLLQVSAHITKAEWEKHIAPMFQKYFSGFKGNTQDHVVASDDVKESIEQKKIQQMIYAYSQFCILIGQETMRRLIPTSDAIENMMYTHFESNEHVPHPAPVIASAKKKAVLSKPVKKNEATPSMGKSGATSPRIIPKRSFSMDERKLSDFVLSGNEPPFLSNSYGKLDIGLEGIIDENNATGYIGSQSPATIGERFKLGSPNSFWSSKVKSSAEDKRNWNRFLSTNSEEMSKSMQFTFNDLKLRTFLGHTSTIKAISVNEPYRIFASASRDRTVKIWSLDVHRSIDNCASEQFSESLVTYNGHRRNGVSDVYFVGNSDDLVASSDGQVHIWDPETGRGLHQFSMGRQPFVSIKPIFKSRQIIGATGDSSITVMDINSLCLLHSWKSSTVTNGTIRIIAVNPSETLVAVGFSTGNVSLIETRTGALVSVWKAADSDITNLKFYTDDFIVTCAASDHMISVWNTNCLELVKTIKVNQDIIALDRFKDELITINNDSSISFISLNETQLQSYSSKFRTGIIKSAITSLGIVPENQLLLIGSSEGEIHLYA